MPPSTLFSCSHASPKTLHSLLSCLSLSTGPMEASMVHVYVSPQYLVFSLNAGSAVSESSVHLRQDIFESFQVSAAPGGSPEGSPGGEEELDQSGEFAVSLPLLVSSLTVFGPAALATSLARLSFSRASQILTVILEDASGATSSMALQGGDVEGGEMEDTLNTAFQAEPIVARTILKSKFLKDAVSELRTAGPAPHISLSISDSCLALSASGPQISTVVSLPRSRGVFSTLVTSPPITHRHRYKVAAFFTAMQDPCFVDFILAPANDDEEDEEDGDAPGMTPIPDTHQTGFSFPTQDDPQNLTYPTQQSSARGGGSQLSQLQPQSEADLSQLEERMRSRRGREKEIYSDDEDTEEELV
ncbi:hypothetical protein TeGR_g7414 [Tetraparma gracilis]|uniref:Cell cycle checkpoint control protein RAD9A n=1 Tax=Tetraparma gracilis TaxID=2962635 RepID=A0ABQ6MVU0_9STRA|nr:hypothetical protein TeGR_g7414 [Tetraparma gracilis]